MTFNNDENKKIFDFILTNKNIMLSDTGLFSRDTLIILRDIIKGRKQNDFVLSKEQENALIYAFLNRNCAFDDDTPNFIRTNLECINVAIERDINSANYIKNFTPELIQKVLNIAISKKYILTADSPSFLKSNYEIALNSIRQDVNTANFVNWNLMKKEDFDNLIQETINGGYLLSCKSSYTLTDNPDIVLCSIEKDFDTLSYASTTARWHPKIFKYLIQSGYKFTKSELERMSIYSFGDPDTMRYAIEKMMILDKNNSDFTDIFEKYPNDIDKYIERFIQLYVKAINNVPTIQGLKSVLEVCAESKWDDYRDENINDYFNIFGKICTELKNNLEFSYVVNKLEFLNKMKDALDDKYNLLHEAMVKYHKIIHSNTKLENIGFARDQIAKLSALYVAISKEIFKKEKMEEYFKDIKHYFIPRKTHPIIYKKIIEQKQKNKFIELYHEQDNEICSFLENIVKEYSEIIDNELLCYMRDNFLDNGYSKMDSFIKAPRGWNNHKRYQEACKLINRLNSHHIKYTDQELVRYRDIIKYDYKTGTYYYDGPTFDEESINRYKEYKIKLQVFEKIKQQIMFKTKELEINSDVSDKELSNISDSLPFNDEYFEFVGQVNSGFDLEDFINSCTLEDDYIEPSSLIDDDVYNVLTNYVINNGLFWMLLFLNRHSDDSLYEIGVCKEIILSSFDYMEDACRLAKILKYDINKYEDVLSLCELSECADDETIAILGKDVIFNLCRYQEYTSEDIEKIAKMSRKLVCEMSKRDKSTVPYINGRTSNYIYSMYNPQDETILLAGINTNACFRIDGNDNDFLHYCALDKNGFVIKITDIFGNFIGRASGFRNGNCVFINQLRTIYDSGGSGYFGDYVNEKNEIIETFYKACNDIVETSQNNKNERYKIDFVFVTKSYALSKIESNVDRVVVKKIGDNPMDTKSEDWKKFVANTANLQEIDDIDDTFSTDYSSNYGLICVASSKKDRIFKKINVRDIKPKDVEALYASPRSKIIITENIDVNIINKINKINALNSYFNNILFESVEMPNGTTVFLGDNWYITYNNGVIIKSCVLDFDKRAIIEFEATKKVIQECKINNNQLNIEKVVEQLETQSSEKCVMVLRLNR